MKKSLLALGAVAALGGLGFSGAANAVWVVGPVNGADAGKLVPADTGVGHILVTPYFSTVNKDGNGANTTLLSVVNTDTENGKAVKVRFRGAANSDDVLDFTVLLSPGDVWSAAVSQGPNGLSRLYSPDTTCVLPDQPNANARNPLNAAPDGIDFSDLRLDQTLSAPVRAAHTQEGYVEWLNMADIRKDSAIYKAIKHSSAGVAPCTPAVMSKLVSSTDNWTVEEAGDSGFVNPTGGLMGNWTIFNNANVTSYGGPASAIAAVDSESGLPSTGRLFFAPQTDKANFPSSPNWAGDGTYFGETADPLLTNAPNGGIAKTPILAFDLPDLSTPYVNGHSWAASQSNALSNALASQTVMNEWTAADAATTNGTYFATDWVFSQPTRRYHVVLDYTATGGPAAVHNLITQNNFYTSSVVEVGKNDYGSMVCLRSGVPVYNIFNREEGTTAPVFDDGQWSPRRPTTNRGFCGEVAVMQFGKGAVRALNGQVTKEVIELGTPPIGGAGWMSMAFSSAVQYGLPVVGYAANTFNGSMGANVGNYGDAITHRYKRSTTQAPAVSGPYGSTPAPTLQ